MFFQHKSEITIKGEEQRTQYVLFTSIQQFGYAAKTSLSICGVNESKLDIDGMGRWVDRCHEWQWQNDRKEREGYLHEKLV
mmetsp:Transcript_29179/g.78968  ORF Transcript_29179/g.78968 Transcript_29179/m.78968 type:complete len:81 (-) Transcript_29179:1125-1367(-)